MDFSQVAAEFQRLKAQYEAGALTEAEFKARLEELMLQDAQGRWWMIGYETGQWYYHDGQQWVRSEPPAAERAAADGRQILARAKRPGPRAIRVTAPGEMIWGPILLITIGWAISWVIGAVISYAISTNYGLLAGWALGGLVIGLTLRWTEPAIRWTHMLMIIIGWVIGWAGAILYEPTVLSMMIGGCTGGLVTGLALRWAQPATGLHQVALVAAGWAISLPLGYVAVEATLGVTDDFSRLVIAAAIAGAIGSGVMFWQLGRTRNRETGQPTL